MPRVPKRKAPASKSVGTKKKAVNGIESDQPSGFVLSMGTGDTGQLGQGDEVLERKKPGFVQGLENVQIVQIIAGGMHSLALSSTGKVYSWGCNDEGALGRHATQKDGDEWLAKEVDLPSGMHVTMISAGDSHSTALTTMGTVYAWGTYRDMSGQVGLRPDGQKSAPVEILSLPNDKITKVVSGNDHTVALTESGNIYTWGCADQGQLGRVAGYFSSRGGRRGLDFVLIPRKVRLRRDTKFKDIFAGSFCTFAIARDSEIVYVWGLNNYGQLATGDTNSSHFPKKSKALSDLNTNIDCPIRIASGQHHSIFSTADGKVYSAGRADYGRLGIGKDATDQNLPAEVQGLSEHKVHRVSCGEVVSFGVTEEGQAYSWGMGSCLQLGSGDDEDVWDPMLVEGKKLVAAEHEVLNVEAGGQHTLILARKK